MDRALTLRPVPRAAPRSPRTASPRGAADRARGQLLALMGRTDEAIVAFEAALRIEAAVGGRLLLARTRYRFAPALMGSGAGPAARALAG